MNTAARVGEEVRISETADGHMGGPGGGDWSRGNIQSRVIGPVIFIFHYGIDLLVIVRFPRPTCFIDLKMSQILKLFP
jgi:hypothetical protein